MMLALSLLLALIPLLGIAWILRYGSITTVDGLFTSLILLAMSGILGINVLLELKKRTPSGRRQSVAQAKATSSGMVQRGKVEKVEFYEANVGLPKERGDNLPKGKRAQCVAERQLFLNCIEISRSRITDVTAEVISQSFFPF